MRTALLAALLCQNVITVERGIREPKPVTIEDREVVNDLRLRAYEALAEMNRLRAEANLQELQLERVNQKIAIETQKLYEKYDAGKDWTFAAGTFKWIRQTYKQEVVQK